MRGGLCLYAVVLALLGFVIFGVNGFGSMSTIAASWNGSAVATVCGILSGGVQGIRCVQDSEEVNVWPNVSFLGISGGEGFFCGLRQGGFHLLCWNFVDGLSSIKRKRISKDTVLSEIVVGRNHICGLTNGTGSVLCWRGDAMKAPNIGPFESISAGSNLTCGISGNGSKISGNGSASCWDVNGTELWTQSDLGLSLLVAGGGHYCGIRDDGVLACWGRNDFGQANAPSRLPFMFRSLALGENHSCAIWRENRTVICWGGGESNLGYPRNESFETIAAGDGYTCGLLSGNFSVFCWGGREFKSGRLLSLPKILPGPCSVSECSCGMYPDSQNFCADSEHVCSACLSEPPSLTAPIPGPSSSPVAISGPSGKREVVNWGLVAFAVVGAIGTLLGIFAVLWCIWQKTCGRQGRVHNSVQPTVAQLHSGSLRRQSSRAIRRQRSGTSSTRSKHGDRAEEFTLAELETATMNFAESNRIGAGSFGTVYRGKLADGREVAIKRAGLGVTKKFQEKETAFQSELAFLSRLHHKHLVSLIGYCEEGDERMLVYEYMPNGALYDHLHKTPETFEVSLLMKSWSDRIRIALDAARGIEYLHTYAVPPIIHRDIKSSNILLDGNWTARVSDFGLSLLGPDVQDGHLSTMAAGTVGYMDPEYYRLHHLTTKSDVYGFGVVLLEILTGQRAIFKRDDGPISVVDYAVPRILSDELQFVLDSRVRPPESHEIEAVELVAYTAVLCVNLEGKDRPSMSDVVTNLERAVAICSRVTMSRSGSLVVTSDDA